MAQERPTHEQITAAVAVAASAAKSAADTRARYSRRRSPRRGPALAAARAACADAAKPLRSWLGMVAWDGISLEDELAMKSVMEDLRYERRQIDKMT